jgi:transglutaminase-like putative cysteine protease
MTDQFNDKYYSLGGAMFRKHSRIIAAIVLGFFTWTSGGVFSIAHAAQLEAKKNKAMTAQQKKAESPEERFSKITEELEGALADTKMDIASKKARLVAGRDEINKLDIEMRAQFTATEQKLKAAKLPAEILERHRKFVKHYDDNLNELKGNVERVEKAKNQAEIEVEVEKTRKHLERVKAPSRHQKLDPNNLPHRQPVVKKREPRMKKEEFEQDLKKDKHAWKNAKRIQVASTGSLAGMLVSNSFNAIAQPTAADLAETIEVQLTPEIRAKALELGNNPVKIYEWVRNNIEFVPTWGSIQGAQMTMLTKQGNAFDTSSLLISLLRAAGIHAHYVTGTITLPIDKVMNWAGGFTDPMAALDFMSSAGIPTKALTEGGKVTQARMEHVSVEAFINYIPFRGGKHVNGKGETWIPLDPSYKQYTYTQGIDIKSAVPFDAQAFLTQIKSTATVNEAQGYVTGVNSTLTQQTMQDYQTQVQSYIQQNHPNATVGDVLGKKEIIKQEFPFLLGTLPYRTAIRGTAFTEVPDTLRHKLTFTVTNGTFDETPLAITKNMAELAGKKITLSYSPATSQDEAVINSFLPKPHTDGTPITSNELPSSFPAYLISVNPELRIDGQVVAIGTAVSLGSMETFNMTFSSPAYSSEIVTNPIYAGAYDGIALNTGQIADAQMLTQKSKLEAFKNKLSAQDLTGLTKDDLLGDILYTTALAYYSQLDTINNIQAKIMGIASARYPSEAIFSSDVSVSMLFGIPRSVSPGGLVMDVDRNISANKALNGDEAKKVQYLLTTGTNSSVFEHAVPEQFFSTPENKVEGISAIKALKIAGDQGIPIYTVNQSNIANVLPQLQVDTHVKTDIQNAVNTGKVVTVSKTDITYNGWTGCGYIITNPDTGEGAYMIAGGQNGAYIFVLWIFITLFVALAGPVIATIIAVGEVAGALIAVLAGTAFGIGGTYAIHSAFNEITEINITTTMIDLVAQLIMAVGVALLTVGAVTGLPLILGTILLSLPVILLDYFIFNYTYAPSKKTYYC